MIFFRQVKHHSRSEVHVSHNPDSAARFSTLTTLSCLRAVKLLHDLRNNAPPFLPVRRSLW